MYPYPEEGPNTYIYDAFILLWTICHFRHGPSALCKQRQVLKRPHRNSVRQHQQSRMRGLCKDNAFGHGREKWHLQQGKGCWVPLLGGSGLLRVVSYAGQWSKVFGKALQDSRVTNAQQAQHVPKAPCATVPIRIPGGGLSSLSWQWYLVPCGRDSSSLMQERAGVAGSRPKRGRQASSRKLGVFWGQHVQYSMRLKV